MVTELLLSYTTLAVLLGFCAVVFASYLGTMLALREFHDSDPENSS
ncbi:hypothetical protein SAMN05421809_0788 [Natronorubrum daqingense]|uniref:Uncharacterized protein n=1 Tax=Natronorubrum daqingense TaxID=588898 RepID=A0A1N6ZFG9_9EURY|nr:hypothetical protein SAMN05421809_0788 [Natronorubrum daqingense]